MRDGMTAFVMAFLGDRGWRVLGVAIFLAVVLAAYMSGFGEIGFSSLAREYAEISQRIAERPVVSATVAIGFYAALVVLLIPGVPLMTVPVGLVFGWTSASLVVVLATLLGITILFFVARRVAPEKLPGRAGGALDRVAGEIRHNAFGYLLFLRLMPVVPFSMLNIALPALKVPYRVFAVTTLMGMLPRIVAYAYAGEGLRRVLTERTRDCAGTTAACTPELSAGDFLTPELLAATGLVAVVSLAPILWRRFSR